MLLKLIKLCRPKQWYKNALVFLALIFSGNLFNAKMFWLCVLGFLLLCCVSSANYAINDIIDRERDVLNPEKRKRPIASGAVKPWHGLLLAAILYIIAFSGSFSLGYAFGLCFVALFGLTLAYSLWLKKEAFADIITIGILFIIRAVSGAFLIGVAVSPWLIFGIFSLAMFLATAKRHSEAVLLGSVFGHRQVLKSYPKEITSVLMVIATTIFVLSYLLYAFLGKHPKLFISLPFVLYTILRYFYLAYSGSVIARHPERALSETRLAFGAALSGVVILLALYV